MHVRMLVIDNILQPSIERSWQVSMAWWGLTRTLIRLWVVALKGVYFIHRCHFDCMLSIAHFATMWFTRSRRESWFLKCAVGIGKGRLSGRSHRSASAVSLAKRWSLLRMWRDLLQHYLLTTYTMWAKASSLQSYSHSFSNKSWMISLIITYNNDRKDIAADRVPKDPAVFHSYIVQHEEACFYRPTWTLWHG